MKLDPWQKEFLETEGDKVLCCGRQIGKSTICAMDAGNWAVKNKNSTILMIAPTERQAYALFEKTLNYLLANYKTYIKKGKDRPTLSRIYLNNGIKIYCLPTGLAGLGIRFLTVGRLYVDEASRITNDVWTAVTPMLLTTGGAQVYLSTPAGSEGYFADVVKNRGEKFNSFRRFFKSSGEVIEAREICESWTKFQREKSFEHLEREKERMSMREFAQEYEGAIIDELRQFFPTKVIEKCMFLKTRINQALPGDNFMGVDVARMGGDENVLFSFKRINKDYLIQLDLEIDKEVMTTYVVRKILNADARHNYSKIYIDDGGMGVAVFDPLLEHEQTKRKVVAINNASRSIRRGREKRLLKEDLYNNLLSLMEKRKVELREDVNIMQSLRSVQYEYVNNKLRIFGNYTHIAEAMIRAAWCMKDKSLNIWFDYM